MKKILRALAILALAVASTLSLLLSQVDGSFAAAQGTLPTEIAAALAAQVPTGAVLLVLLGLLYAYALFQSYAWHAGDRVKLCLLSLLFAGIAAVGAAYRADDGSLAAFPLRLHYAYLAGKAIGFFGLAWGLGKAILLALPKLSRHMCPMPPADRRSLRRTFFLCWGLILLGWLPAILARLPGVLSADAGRVLQQYTGEIVWTSDHPPAYTLLLGGLVTLGKAIGGDAFGLAFYTALQALFLSAAMAYGITALRRENVARVAQGLLLAYFILSPMSWTHAALVIKDVPYTAAFYLYLTLVYRALMHPDACGKSPRWWLGYVCVTLLMVLLRPNGMLVAVPTAILLAVGLWRALQGRIRASIALLAVPMLLFMAYNAMIVPRFAYQPESTADVLGVPFQQLSRILKNSPQDATATELATLDRILQADRLGPSYQAKNSDPVRKLFRYFNGHSNADVLAAVGVWARLSATHPLAAFHALWSLNGGYLDPFDLTAQTVIAPLRLDSPKYPAAFAFTPTDAPAPWQATLLTLEATYRAFPPVAAATAPGLWAWLALLTAFLISRTHRRSLRWLLLPLWLTLLACLLSAGFTSGSRYALPLMFGAPWTLCALLPAILSTSAANAVREPSANPSDASEAPLHSHP